MRLLYVLLLSTVAGLGVSQVQGGGDPPDDDYNNYEPSRNKLAVVSVQGLAVNQLVSGTKVEFSIKAEVGERPHGPDWTSDEDTNWTKAFVSSVSLKIGGQSVTPLPTIPSGEDSYSKSVRFASTHFNDGSDINLELTATFVFQRLQGTTVVESETSDPITKIIKVKAYNKSLIMATQYADAEDTSDPPPSPPGYLVTHNRAACGEANSHLQACNITTLAGTSPNFIVGAISLTNNLPKATLFFAAVHGNNQGLNDSWNQFYGWGDLGSRIISDQIKPPYVAISYACSSDPVNLYGTWALLSPNEGSGAFTADISTLCTNSMTIQDHAHFLMNNLAMGKTLKQSVDLANDECRPFIVPGIGSSIAMSTYGDPLTRIQYVYLTAAERQALGAGVNLWFYVLP